MHRSPAIDPSRDRTVNTGPGSDVAPFTNFRPDTLIRDLWLSIKIHRWSGIAFGLLLFGISLAAALLVKNTYRSEASVFVKLGRESVALDPTVTSTQTITVNETREVEVNSILEVLNSRVIASRVVEKLGAETILSGKLPGDEAESSWLGSLVSSTMDSLRRFNDGREVSLEERATRRVLKKLDVFSAKRTTVIQLSYSAKTPEAAQAVLATVLDIFQDEHVRINRTQGSYDFLTEQAGVLEEKLLNLQNEHREEKNRLNLVTIDGARNKLQEEINLLSLNMINARAEMSASESRIADLSVSSNTLPERLHAEDVTGLPNEATDRMRDALYQLQLREKDFLAKYAEDHPNLLQIREQLAEAESIYSQQTDHREQKTTAIHPVKQHLEQLLLIEQSTAAALRGQVKALEERMQDALNELYELNTNEVRLAQLERQIDQAESSFRTYSDRLEQSRLDHELQSQRISNVNVIQPASYQEKPAGPPRLILLIAGAVLAVVGGLATCVLSELFSPTLKSATDVEQSLAIPVVMALSPGEQRAPALSGR